MTFIQVPFFHPLDVLLLQKVLHLCTLTNLPIHTTTTCSIQACEQGNWTKFVVWGFWKIFWIIWIVSKYVLTWNTLRMCCGFRDICISLFCSYRLKWIPINLNLYFSSASTFINYSTCIHSKFSYNFLLYYLLHFPQIQSSDAFRSPISFQHTTTTTTAQTNSATSKSTDSDSDCCTSFVSTANKSKSALHVVRNIGKPSSKYLLE